MKYILKRFWIVICIALIINIPLLVIGCVRTNKTILLKGDTVNINSVVEIDTNYKEEGSFSSIYVISFDRSTIFQNLVVGNSKTSEVSEINEITAHISDKENYEAGQIQKNSSIMTAIINAYNEAKKKDSTIKIDYSFKSICVSFYYKDSPFRIGDEIIKINNVSASEGLEAFKNELNNIKIGDTIKVIRNDIELDIVLNRTTNLFSSYAYYNIDYNTISPSVKINSSNVGGPSGGLLQTLSIYNRLLEFDLTKGLKISGTGTISINGNVGQIGGIKQKVFTAFDDNVDVFLCPEEDYSDALEAYNKIKHNERMALVKVSTLADAIEYLENA